MLQRSPTSACSHELATREQDVRHGAYVVQADRKARVDRAQHLPVAGSSRPCQYPRPQKGQSRRSQIERMHAPLSAHACARTSRSMSRSESILFALAFFLNIFFVAIGEPVSFLNVRKTAPKAPRPDAKHSRSTTVTQASAAAAPDAARALSDARAGRPQRRPQNKHVAARPRVTHTRVHAQLLGSAHRGHALPQTASSRREPCRWSPRSTPCTWRARPTQYRRRSQPSWR
jgi:hypothetical protein